MYVCLTRRTNDYIYVFGRAERVRYLTSFVGLAGRAGGRRIFVMCRLGAGGCTDQRIIIRLQWERRDAHAT